MHYILGNDIIHELTSQRQYKLRIDMTSQINGSRFALYDNFYVGNESSKYELTVGGYWGNAGKKVEACAIKFSLTYR